MPVIRLDTYITRIAGDCDDCGFSALRRLRLYELAAAGVKTYSDTTYCARCRTEAMRGERA